ncbi:MAG: flagellar hook protein, partial [Actinomycetes bacterium]
LNRNLDAVGRLQQQLTSGRLISAPSDSPTGTNRSMQTRSDQMAVDQQARNITDAKSWLESADSVLQSMVGAAQRVRDLTVQGSNTGSLSPASQAAIGMEVSALREALLGQANRTVQGRPLFGGVTSGTVAYDPLGNFVGQGGAPILRRVSDTEAVRVDLTGPEVFGPPGNDLFAIVGKIAADVTANPAALAGHLSDLDAVIDGLLNGVSDVGARAKRIERAEQINGEQALVLQSRLAETENIDLPMTVMQLQMRQVGYEAALSATAKSLQPTLVDFLR